MQTGTKISGAAHIVVIGFALFGGALQGEPPPLQVTEVSLISSEQYAALTSTQETPEVSETPEAEAVPEESAAPEPAPAEPVAEPEKQPEPEPVAEPEPPAPEVTEAPPTAEPPAPEVVEAPEPEKAPEQTPTPPKLDRVAPEVVAEPPPEAKPDVVEQEQVTEEEGAETPQEQQEATAPEQATDRIVPEEQVVALAPVTSRRPPSGSRPDRPSPTPAAAPKPDTPEPKPTPEAVEPKPEAPATNENAVRDAVAEALAGAQNAAPAPSGPPLSAGEKDALRVAVSKCWNLGSLSSVAAATTVVVSVTMGQDGKPDTGSIKMLSSSGGDTSSARQAFEAARRAIIRCGSSGYDLPVEKYAHWREIEMTFNPERMRIK